MSNYNFSNTLDGLNNIDANDINTDNIVTDYLTVNINSAVPLVTPYTANTNQIASCAFVQNAVTTNLANYALLNPVTPQTFTGSQNFPTQAITNNTTLVATTAYVKSNLLSYALLGSANTFTAINTFNALTIYNAPLRNFNSIQAVFPGDIRMLDSTQTRLTQMYQNGTTCVIDAPFASSRLTITTNDAATLGLNNLLIENKNHIVLQGAANEGIDILNNQITMNGNLALNKLFVSNYVDLTLTTYENQFFGDIYGYRGVVCQNGFYVKDGPGPGANTYALIDTSGNISTTTTISATGNISTLSNISANSITLPANSINDSYLSSNIPKKNAANTFTAVNTFNAATLCNATLKNTGSTQVVFPGDFRMLDSTQTFLTQMYQNNLTCVIDAPFASSKMQFSTRNASNIGLNNLVMELGNHIVLQGSSSEIDITGTAVTLNGVCTFSNATTPVITTTIPTADNSTKIATTAYVKGQGYATTASLSSYALLTATQTFTGTQTFTATSPTQPLVIKNTVSGNSGGLIVSGSSSYNAINSPGDFSVIGFGPTVDTGVLTLTTWAGSSCGIRIDKDTMKFYAPLGAWYNSLTPVPALNVYDIGFNFISAGATWTNWVGNTAATPGNVVTLTFNGVGAYKIGTYLVDIVLSTNCASPPESFLIWTTVGPTSGAYNTTCTHSNDSGFYNGASTQALRMSFVLIVSTPTTYYLNYNRIGGSGLAENKTNSQISFTRMG